MNNWQEYYLNRQMLDQWKMSRLVAKMRDPLADAMTALVSLWNHYQLYFMPPLPSGKQSSLMPLRFRLFPSSDTANSTKAISASWVFRHQVPSFAKLLFWSLQVLQMAVFECSCSSTGGFSFAVACYPPLIMAWFGTSSQSRIGSAVFVNE